MNWDEFIVPKPFGTVVHVIGSSIDVRDYSSTEEIKLELKNEMDKTQVEADEYFN